MSNSDRIHTNPESTFHTSNPEAFARPGAVVEVDDRRGFPGVHVVFENGWTLSIKWGPHSYGSNQGNYGSNQGNYGGGETAATTAEIVAWRGDGDGELLDWTSGNAVAGWQPFAHVMHLLDLMAEDKLSPAQPLPAWERTDDE